MNGADYLILVILIFSMLLGMFRGFVSESIALLAWLCGLWLAWRYAPLLEPFMGGALGEPPLSTWAARTLIVITVVIIGSLASGLFTYLLRHSALSLTVDRMLGTLFGIVRAMVVISAFILLAQFARFDQTSWWRKSQLIPYASECAGWIQAFAETGMTMLEQQTSRPPARRASPGNVPGRNLQSEIGVNRHEARGLRLEPESRAVTCSDILAQASGPEPQACSCQSCVAASIVLRT